MNSKKKLKIFFIAGEASGDLLGSKLIDALIKRSPTPIELYGVGGVKMQQQGLKSLFPIEEISLMGFAEILPHIPNLLRRIKQTVNSIKSIQPDILITIDSPGFCFRVAKQLQDSKIKMVHYVAPTVWAYKPERAAKFAELYDHMLALLPFEPPYFEKEGLPCTFVGHPIVEDYNESIDTTAFRTKYSLKSDDKLLCLMPGSREVELFRLFPIFIQAAKLLNEKISNLRIIIITLPQLLSKLKAMLASYSLPITIITDPDEKKTAIAACNLALVKSGTGTFEVAMAKVPMIVAYKVNWLSALLLKKMLKVPFANLINLIANREVIPEFLQEKCTYQALVPALEQLLNDHNAHNSQLQAVYNAMQTLGYGTYPTPSERAAIAVLQLLAA